MYHDGNASFGTTGRFFKVKDIKVNKDKLITILKSNRDKHRQIFLEAVDGYRKRLLKELEDQVEQVKQGKHIDRIVHFPEPQDQTKDYERVIGMLEMSNDTEIELSEANYAQYVMDDWQWSREWLHNQQRYSTHADLEVQRRYSHDN